MALVILPCDLPHWCNLQKYLSLLSGISNSKQLIEIMLQIHNLCNISTGLDPDEPDTTDPNIFSKLEIFLANLSKEEQNNFYHKILPVMTRRALDLKALKPQTGFHFSLQQQEDELTYKRSFLASLLSHSFFSTFPKRTWKTHPTLQDFNFSFFFKFLDQPCQQAKLKSIFHYFELLENTIDDNECVTYSRQVMCGRQWLTIDDWIESCSPLCPIAVLNDGTLSEAEPQYLRICFSSSKIGGSVLCEGTSQESVEFCTVPELICILASVEALEDNETLLIRDAYQVSKIKEPRKRVILEKYTKPVKLSICCMDAENYSRLPLGQLEEDNILRELNKALLGFRQGKPMVSKPLFNSKAAALKRLSPIGESFNSTQNEKTLSKDEGVSSLSSSTVTRRNKAWLNSLNYYRDDKEGNKRRRFLVLGSSGELLPITRNQFFLAGRRGIFSTETTDNIYDKRNSLFSSSQSEEDEEEIFHSAATSLESEKEILYFDCNGNVEELFDPSKTNITSSPDVEKRLSFVDRLRETLMRGAKAYSKSSDDSRYAVDISVSGSRNEGDSVWYKRKTSTGFILQEDPVTNYLYHDTKEQKNNENKNQDDVNGSDLEDIYLQLSNWIIKGKENESMREEAIPTISTNLIKRAFSDSFIQENHEFHKRERFAEKRFRSEVVKGNPELITQLISFLNKHDLTLDKMTCNKYGQKPVATGNWGCGSYQGGDPQIKFTIQWLAASYTGLPNLDYYTCRNHKLVKLDTVRRILLDRKWTVGQLTSSLLHYAQKSLNNTQISTTLFDHLISHVKV